jgi:Uma2 family endonuclease
MARTAAATAPVDERRLTMTHDAFLDWLGEDETRHGEWVDGEVIVFMPTTVFHARMAGFLYALLSFYVRYRGLGEVLASSLHMRVRAGRSSREPDLFFVAHDSPSRLIGAHLEGPADLVVELVSDGSVRRDRLDKVAEYAQAGVPEYWLLDPHPASSAATSSA